METVLYQLRNVFGLVGAAKTSLEKEGADPRLVAEWLGQVRDELADAIATLNTVLSQLGE